MNGKENNMSLLGWLGLSFIILKLLNFITWSWWLVLLPLYGGFILIFLVYIIIEMTK